MVIHRAPASETCPNLKFPWSWRRAKHTQQIPSKLERHYSTTTSKSIPKWRSSSLASKTYHLKSSNLINSSENSAERSFKYSRKSLVHYTQRIRGAMWRKLPSNVSRTASETSSFTWTSEELLRKPGIWGEIQRRHGMRSWIISSITFSLSFEESLKLWFDLLETVLFWTIKYEFLGKI